MESTDLLPFNWQAARHRYQQIVPTYTHLDAPKRPTGKSATSGGVNNNYDTILGHWLAWKFFRDRSALEQACFIADWMVDLPIDNGHNQRWPSLALLMLELPIMGSTLRDPFMRWFGTLGNNKYLSTFTGMTLRPWLRFVGSTLRACSYVEAMAVAGVLSKAEGRFAVELRADLIARVIEWMNIVRSHDSERGWLGPGFWPPADQVRPWPWQTGGYGHIGSNEQWFMHGSILPWAMLQMTHYTIPGHRTGFMPWMWPRLKETCAWALRLGFDPKSGLHLSALKRGTFRPDDPRLQRQFRAQPNLIASEAEKYHSCAGAILLSSEAQNKKMQALNAWAGAAYTTHTPGIVDDQLVYGVMLR